jgi:hypothetical protein
MKKTLAILFAVISINFFSMDFEWSHTYQKESSKDLVTLINKMCVTFSVNSSLTDGFKIERPAFQMVCSNGTIYYENDEQNIFRGFFYEGDATINFAVNDTVEQERLQRFLGGKEIKNLSVKSFYVLPIGNCPDLPTLKEDGSQTSPPSKDFSRFKTALRREGIDTLSELINNNLADPMDIIIVFEMKDDVWAYRYDSRLETEVQLLRLAHPIAQDDFFWDKVSAIHRTKSGSLTPEITQEEYKEKYLFDVKGYEIDYKMDDNGKILNGNVIVKVSLKKPHRALLFRYFADYYIVSVKVDGEDASFIKEDCSEKWGYYEDSLLVGFKTPKEGDITLTFRTAGILFKPANGYLFLRDEDLWYPSLKDWDGATYKLKMTVPKDNEVIAIGELKSHAVNDDSTETFLWESEIPVKLATFVIGKFIHKIMDAEGLKLDVALPKGVRTNLLTQAQDYTLNELKNDIVFYSKVFGRLPYPTLKVAITHYSHGRGFPTMLLLSESAFFRLGSTWPDQFMAHEVSHQWWGNLVDGLSYRDVWLSEGMAEFSSMLYMGLRFGEDKVKLYHENMLLKGTLVKTSSLDSNINAEENSPTNEFNPFKLNSASMGDMVVPFEEGPICLGSRLYSTFTTKPYLGYQYVVYTKGNFVFQMLFALSKFTKGGQDSFFKGLQTICSKYRGQKISTKMFFGEMQNSMGVPLSQFLKDWYESTGMPKVEVKTDVVSRDGGYVITATGKCDRNNFFGVPVRVSLDDKRKFDYILLFQNGKAQGEWKTPSKPKKIDVDPMRIVFCKYGNVK